MPDQQQNADSRCPANRVFNIVGVVMAFLLMLGDTFVDGVH